MCVCNEKWVVFIRNTQLGSPWVSDCQIHFSFYIPTEENVGVSTFFYRNIYSVRMKISVDKKYYFFFSNLCSKQITYFFCCHVFSRTFFDFFLIRFCHFINYLFELLWRFCISRTSQYLHRVHPCMYVFIFDFFFRKHCI